MLRIPLRVLLFACSMAVFASGSLTSVNQPSKAFAAEYEYQPSPMWMVTPQGYVWGFGSATDYGDLTDQTLNKPIVGMAATPTNKGYWLVASDGGIFSFGDAAFLGSTGGIKLNKPIVGMASTPTGKGYWLVASDGGIFSFGDAGFFGSTGSLKLNKPIVAMAATPTNKGYWLVATDGGIFSFGDAGFFGSTGSLTLNKPIIAMSATPTNKGYWLVASDGGIFNFGDAGFYGSMGGSTDTWVSIVTAKDGKGYWLIRNGGEAFPFGTAAVSSGQGGNQSQNNQRPTIAIPYNSGTKGERAVSFAMSQLGKPYLWGGNGPDAYDCSGLTSKSWREVGVSIPRVANDQYNFGTRIPLNELRPGDLLFWGPDQANDRSIDHVGMYIGGGWAINSGGTGTGVNIRNVKTTSGWMWQYGVRPAA